jgi:hypothetical protein
MHPQSRSSGMSANGPIQPDGRRAFLAIANDWPEIDVETKVVIVHPIEG